MEQWQREHIRKNLVELMQYTNCNVELIASLTSANILSQSDAELLEVSSLTRSEKSKKLYEISCTRVDSYNILIASLKNTRQSGAVRILQNHPLAPKDNEEKTPPIEEEEPSSPSSWSVMNHIRHLPVARTFNNLLGSNVTSIYNRSEYDIMVATNSQPTTLTFAISNGRIQLESTGSSECLQKAHIAKDKEFRFRRTNSVDYLTVAMNQNGNLLETTNFPIIANVSYKIGNDCIPRELDYNKSN